MSDPVNPPTKALDSPNDDRPDDGVKTGAVTATRQYSDSLRFRHGHIFLQMAKAKVNSNSPYLLPSAGLIRRENNFF